MLIFSFSKISILLGNKPARRYIYNTNFILRVFCLLWFAIFQTEKDADDPGNKVKTNNSLHLVSEIPMKATETKEMPLLWGSKAFRKQNLSIRLHKISKPQYCCTKNTPDGLSQPVSICYVRYGIIIIL